ncbi:Cysteine--tRNA ligase [Urinicoccus massiliensis]|uniref:Cysteine--tRNA ligase n=1 Tax=Urinicoccus massiliensis TaxID=1723382 RepID=A0A8H2QYT7_9FIRM|nr:cysteine--tRNA ligase [Urinicoccus massiliensis]VFB17099.1 Cysteine--tRNA ligase [Urinicoccus massiliensis]
MKLYNTLTRKKEEFEPLQDKHVRMYNCGPTVYNYIHVGNARPMVVFDSLRRYFIYKGWDVDFVVNFTDIDDKIIKKANEEGLEAKEIAERYIAEFKKDAQGLNLYEYKTINPRATEYMDEIIHFIKDLVDKGAAYELDGDVYFDITKAKDYGKLSGKNLDELQSGARIDVNEKKKNPGDFALWKKKKEGEPAWESPWSQGRPGWHIECSVMAKTLLGKTIDIHTGGEDLEFPHHENEIAQSEAHNGQDFARFWLHNGMITVDHEKMSKSKGNFFTVRDISKEYDLEVLRLFLISSHYRNPINFSKEVMDQNKNALERLYNTKDRLEGAMKTAKSGSDPDFDQDIQQLKEEFCQAMEDDMNTADALSRLFDLSKRINQGINEEIGLESLGGAQETYLSLAKVLGLLYKEEDQAEEEVLKLIKEREEARKNKDFAQADALRDQLLEMGIAIEDSRDGTKWKRI